MGARRAHALVALLGCAQAWLWTALWPAGTGAPGFAWRAVVLLALQLAAVAIAWNLRGRGVLWLVVGFALVFRVAAWTWPPNLSSDLYRYAWDGRVQLSGRSPYRAPPASAELASLRDEEIWPRINRPEAVTVYPPGSQMAFFALAAVGGDSVRGIKTAALLSELVALALVVIALRRRRLPEGRLALYAWCPLVVAEVCVSGHVEALVLPLVLGALLLAEERRPWWAGGLVGMATLVKLYPALLVAALPRGLRWKAAVVAGAVVVTGYAPYAAASGTRVLGFLPDYVRSGEDFNSGLRGLVESALDPVLPSARPVAMGICFVALVAALGWLARRPDRDPARKARSVALAFVLLLPTAIHPWYALWLVPLLAIHPSAAGLWLVGALPLSYLKYGAPGEEMPAWVLHVEWLPAFALVLSGWARRRATAPEPT